MKINSKLLKQVSKVQSHLKEYSLYYVMPHKYFQDQQEYDIKYRQEHRNQLLEYKTEYGRRRVAIVEARLGKVI